jgi:hypothetical protein
MSTHQDRRLQDELPQGEDAGNAPLGGGKLRLSFLGRTRGLTGIKASSSPTPAAPG